VAGKAIPPAGGNNNDSDAILSFWQGSFEALNVFFRGGSVFPGAANDASWHTVELHCNNGRYEIVVDSKPVYTSEQINDRPTALWFGNSVTVGSNSSWSNLEIDYIRIKQTQ